MFKHNGPFSPFNNDHPFSNHQGHYPKDYMKQIKGMMNKYNQLIDDDFWETINNLQSISHKKGSSTSNHIPIEIWETDEMYYLLLYLPGLKNKEDIRLLFEDDETLFIRAKIPSLQPIRRSTKLHSDFPNEVLERKVDFPEMVSTRSYSISYNDGIVSISLNKEKEDIDIPFDF
jgi:HSP20 family molecular chaperone IbpA